MVVDEVFPGLEQAPAAQYVMMKMQAPVQTLVFGQPVTAQNGSGEALANFGAFCLRGPTGSRNDCSLPKVSPACAAGGCPDSLMATGSKILFATRWAEGLFCVTADQVATGSLPYPDGRVCWGDCAVQPQSIPTECNSGPVDCVAYGNFTGDNGIYGMPAVSPPLGDALVGASLRMNQFNLGGNLLGSSVGFSVGAPTPENFHGDVGAVTGTAGDPDGTGEISTDAVDKEVSALFEADHRCALAANRRGADANFDTLINAADVIATIQIVAKQV